MNDNDGGFVMGCIAFIFFALVISGIFFPVIYFSDEKEVRIRAVQSDHAYYDSKTGDFTWSDNVSKYIFTGEKK